MPSPRAWRADPDDAETVARLIAGFRDYYGRDKPNDNTILAGVEKLLEQTDTEFLLAAPDDDSPPLGVAQLRFRFCLWTASPDCWLEDLFFPQPEWIVDAVHERIVPLPGHVPSANYTDGELIRRSRLGV